MEEKKYCFCELCEKLIAEEDMYLSCHICHKQFSCFFYSNFIGVYVEFC